VNFDRFVILQKQQGEESRLGAALLALLCTNPSFDGLNGSFRSGRLHVLQVVLHVLHVLQIDPLLKANR